MATTKRKMKFTLLLLLCLANAATIPTFDLQDIIDQDSISSYVTDGQITSKVLATLISISTSNSTKCQKCKDRLVLGQSLALVRPDLVPGIWTQWCNSTNVSTPATCQQTYGRNTVKNSGTGTNFVNMLTVMDPQSLDGDYYCHYKESSACPLPDTPEVDISYMWPQKPAKAYIPPESSNSTFNVLHISDIHVEMDYTIGSEANCSTSMCCTPHSKNAKSLPNGYNFTKGLSDQQILSLNFYNSSYIDGQFKLGKDQGLNSSVWEPAYGYGFYECDSPEILINSSLDSIVKYQRQNNITFDFAIFTGDLVDHDEIQYVGYNMTVESEEVVFNNMKSKLQNIPVYSVLGNHDTFPYGELAQEKYGFSNMFDWNAELMAEMWADFEWLDWNEAQYAKYHYSGFSVTTKRGLKIVSLNSNCWYVKNNYAYGNMTQDPDSFGQFEFLVNELVEAEENDQRVWIISHIPMSADILPISAKLFASIIERFSPYTIAALFNGHTHRDEFELLYSTNGTDSSLKTGETLVNNVWITRAVTPWVENNPGWRYYEVDSKTFSIMNSFNYYTKLNETFYNNGDEPVWNFEYSARDAYNIDWPKTNPLNASYWQLVAESMKNDKQSLQNYENHAKRFSPYTDDCVTTDNCDWDWCYVTSFTVDQLANCYAAEKVTPPSS
ncbi:DEKNAAC101622 [Brettanomyces naardenensis]|uniref:DEKNAAC101622 n=1 Tax=Brettanomyces naardenensis TaxID=13370 RepID=A0A448YIK0_BRENA|nr:DEKNAAC101622 [Brettanomyces naardenensis]